MVDDKDKKNVGGEDVMISDNLNTFYDLNKDVREFIYHSDRINSDHERNVIFHHLQDFLNEKDCSYEMITDEPSSWTDLNK